MIQENSIEIVDIEISFIGKNGENVMLDTDKETRIIILSTINNFFKGDIPLQECKCFRFMGGSKWHTENCPIHK